MKRENLLVRAAVLFALVLLLPAGGTVLARAEHEPRIYVANAGANTVTVIDPGRDTAPVVVPVA